MRIQCQTAGLCFRVPHIRTGSKTRIRHVQFIPVAVAASNIVKLLADDAAQHGTDQWASAMPLTQSAGVQIDIIHRSVFNEETKKIRDILRRFFQISSKFLPCFFHISSMFLPYFFHVSSIFLPYFFHVSSIYLPCFQLWSANNFVLVYPEQKNTNP